MSGNTITARLARHSFSMSHVLLALLTVPGGCSLATQAVAEERHAKHTFSVPGIHAADAALAGPTTLPKRIVALQANLTQVAIPIDADGFDLWPCFGTPAGNPDCPSVGNPLVPLPLGGAVVGFPSSTWSLAASSRNGDGIGCDALSNGTTGPGPAHSQYVPCTQIATWFEDDTFDSTDDLLQRVVVTQGERVIYDSGTVDYGPAGPHQTYPVTVILNTDANFGFWPGAATGPNNGNCFADTNYPLTAPTFPAGIVYSVAAGQTCQEPAAGPAKFNTVTVLATPEYTQVTGDACSSKGVASPCYTVRWTRHYEIHQDFEILFE